MKTHSYFVSSWERELTSGIATGRPFSHRTIEVYRYYLNKFLVTHQALSIQTIKAELLSIDPSHFARKDKIYKVLVSFAKYLIQEGELEREFLEQIKSIRPKRHLPPKRLTVDKEGLERLLIACIKMQRLSISTLKIKH